MAENAGSRVCRAEDSAVDVERLLRPLWAFVGGTGTQGRPYRENGGVHVFSEAHVLDWDVFEEIGIVRHTGRGNMALSCICCLILDALSCICRLVLICR